MADKPQKPPKWTGPLLTDPDHPPWHPQNPANIGLRPFWPSPTYASASGYSQLGLPDRVYGRTGTYDNVTGNPKYPSQPGAGNENPSYRWDGKKWVR